MEVFEEYLVELAKKKGTIAQEEDFLSREDVINKISKIIDSRLNSKEGLSLAITGNWGVGKSYVLNVLEKKYQNQSILFHYDCWKNDFYEEPLIAILSCISRKLNSIKTDDYEDFQKQYYSAMKEIVFRLSQAVINNFVGFDFEKIRKSFFLIKDIFKNNTAIETEHFDYLSNVSDVIELVNSLLCEYMVFENKKIILVIDELDRCLPDYAIKVLNRLHHICYNTPIIIIATINDKELLRNINATYQRELDDSFAHRYLQRFFTHFFRLPIGNSNKIVQSCWSDFGSFYHNSQNEKIFSRFSSVVLSTFPIREQKQIIVLLRDYHKQTLGDSKDTFPLELACAELLEVIKAMLSIHQDWTLTNDVTSNDAFVDVDFDDDGYPWLKHMKNPYSLTIESLQVFNKNHTDNVTTILTSESKSNRNLSLDMIKAFFIRKKTFPHPGEGSEDEDLVGEITKNSDYLKSVDFFNKFKETLKSYE